MTIEHRNEANARSPRDPSPSDERLIDYLMGEPAGDDPAIELWLAADRANVSRLDRLAEAMVAASMLAGQMTDREGDWVATAATDGPSRLVGLARHRFALVIVTLAASGLVAVFWPGRMNANNDPDGQIAVAWAEGIADAHWDPQTALADPADLLADSSDEEAEEGIDDETPAPTDIDLMAEDDSPPPWLVLAVAQMSTTADGEGPDDSSGEVFQ
jgi:hypothetical protein